MALFCANAHVFGLGVLSMFAHIHDYSFLLLLLLFLFLFIQSNWDLICGYDSILVIHVVRCPTTSSSCIRINDNGNTIMKNLQKPPSPPPIDFA